MRCVVCGKVAKSKADGSKGGPKWEGPLCSAHLEKLRRNGDPRISKKAGPPKGVPLKRVGGERYAKGDGYIKVWLPSHPNSDKTGHVLEHRLVMSEDINRPLESHETVHHINGNRSDNRIENLELWSGKHLKGARVRDQIEEAITLLKRHGYQVTKERTCE